MRDVHTRSGADSTVEIQVGGCGGMCRRGMQTALCWTESKWRTVWGCTDNRSNDDGDNITRLLRLGDFVGLSYCVLLGWQCLDLDQEWRTRARSGRCGCEVPALPW